MLGILTSRFRIMVGIDCTFHGVALNGLEGVFHLRPLPQSSAVDGKGGRRDLLRTLAYVNDHGGRTSYRFKCTLDQGFDISAVLDGRSYQYGGNTLGNSHVLGTRVCRPHHTRSKR